MPCTGKKHGSISDLMMMLVRKNERERKKEEIENVLIIVGWRAKKANKQTGMKKL